VRHVAPDAERLHVTDGQIEVEIAGGHRLRVSGANDPEALARLIRGLSG
jgi:transposase